MSLAAGLGRRLRRRRGFRRRRLTFLHLLLAIRPVQSLALRLGAVLVHQLLAQTRQAGFKPTLEALDLRIGVEVLVKLPGSIDHPVDVPLRLVDEVLELGFGSAEEAREIVLHLLSAFIRIGHCALLEAGERFLYSQAALIVNAGWSAGGFEA